MICFNTLQWGYSYHFSNVREERKGGKRKRKERAREERCERSQYPFLFQGEKLQYVLFLRADENEQCTHTFALDKSSKKEFL